MSQAFYYKCDGCGKPTGDKAHITLQINPGTGSGIAVPHAAKNDGHMVWETKSRISGLMHFHNSKCLAAFFDKCFAYATKKA